MSSTTFIYALCEPGTRTVRYIGKSDNPTRRLGEHLRHSTKAHTYLGNWLRSIISLGEKPSLVILREVLSEDWQVAEERYIRLARGLQMRLVNSSDGGEGVTQTPEVRNKIGRANSGKKFSLEHRAKLRAMKLGKPMREETKEKLRRALKGRRPSEATFLGSQNPESRKKMGAHQKGVPRSAETKAKISATKRGVPNEAKKRWWALKRAALI